jgi:ribosomal protein S17E
MFSLTEAELDALFIDSVEEPVEQAQQQCTFSPFNTLPPELRNHSYSQYFIDYFTTNPAIKINAHGKIVKPSITYASEELQNETEGYFTTYLKEKANEKDLQIEAQIQEYSLLPLPKTLRLLSDALPLTYEDLSASTAITFHGYPSFQHLQSYITAYLADPSSYAVYWTARTITCKQAVHLDCYGTVTPFLNELGLDAIIDTFEHFHYLRTVKESEETGPIDFAQWSGNDGEWRYHAQRFLQNAALLEFGPSGVESTDDREIAKVVFEVVANWHAILAEELGEQGVKRAMKSALGVMRTRHVEMANVVWDFQCSLGGVA